LPPAMSSEEIQKSMESSPEYLAIKKTVWCCASRASGKR
jgi:hypothetical protein